MGLRSGISAAINARVATTVDYDIDPRGLGMFQALAGSVQRGLNGTDGLAYGAHEDDPNGMSWNGDTRREEQRMRGSAALGTSRSVNARYSEIGKERASHSTNPLDNAAFRIFAERAARSR